MAFRVFAFLGKGVYGRKEGQFDVFNCAVTCELSLEVARRQPLSLALVGKLQPDIAFLPSQLKK